MLYYTRLDYTILYYGLLEDELRIYIYIYTHTLVSLLFYRYLCVYITLYVDLHISMYIYNYTCMFFTCASIHECVSKSLVKACSLNHMGIKIMISKAFFNQGLLEDLGA